MHSIAHVTDHMTDHVTDHVTAGDMWSALDSSRDRSGSRSRGGAHGARCTERGTEMDAAGVRTRTVGPTSQMCAEVSGDWCLSCSRSRGTWVEGTDCALGDVHMSH